MKINLHRTEGNMADWEHVQKEERTSAQKIASATNGIITPANIVSATGLAVGLKGSYDIAKGDYAKGLVETGVGFALDAIDGIVADKTGTKSPLGEVVDAVVDKVKIIALGGAIAVRAVAERRSPVPVGEISGIAVVNYLNARISYLAKKQGLEIHSSKENKVGFGLQPTAIGLHLLARAVEEPLPETSKQVHNLATGVSVGAIAISTLGAKNLHEQSVAGALEKALEE